MELDDQQRTTHNARLLAENAKTLETALIEVGFRNETIDVMMGFYFKAIMEGAQMAEASKILSQLNQRSA